METQGFLKKVITAFADSKLTPLIILSSILVGVLSVFSIPREEEPQIKVPMFDILVSFPGASSEEIENRIVNLGELQLW